jgi:hypothetical protein
VGGCYRPRAHVHDAAKVLGFSETTRVHARTQIHDNYLAAKGKTRACLQQRSVRRRRRRRRWATGNLHRAQRDCSNDCDNGRLAHKKTIQDLLQVTINNISN